MRPALYLILRYAKGDQNPAGLVIKHRSAKLFSERAGRWRGFDIGPIYIRTYQRRDATP